MNLIALITKMKNTKIIGVSIGQKSFWENLSTFRNNYEVYYLPEQLLDELNFYLDKQTEITNRDIEKILKLIENHTEKEFKIKSLMPI